MNDKKFCFIMCTNNQQYKEECLYYINNIKIPEGYEIEIQAIEGATSMTSGYNTGMYQSDAKYKIYLHQDVFIVNNAILYDILKYFTDPKVGMIGVVGCPDLNNSHIMWRCERVGMLHSNSILFAASCLFGDIESDYCEVDAIDGLIMITQYDIPWREDLFQKWDFYDVSQCKEFMKECYKVIVPRTKAPWCIHDDGFIDMTNYYNEREIYRKEYCQ